jgi:hypothetical protein
MKPSPPPSIPGDTDAERFDNAVRRIFSVSKQERHAGGGSAEGAKAEEASAKTKSPPPCPLSPSHASTRGTYPSGILLQASGSSAHRRFILPQQLVVGLANPSNCDSVS